MTDRVQRPPYDVIFFDMGFTLIRFEPSDLDNSLRAYREVGLDLDRHELGEAREYVWADYNRESRTREFEASEEYAREFWFAQERAALERLGIDDELILSAYYERYHEIYEEAGRIRAYPDVLEVLPRLCAAGFRLGMISNWGWNLPFRSEQAGIAQYFACIVASARVGCDKPHPRIFRHALACMDVDAARAVHVGDIYEADVLGARSVGMDAVLIEREGRPQTADELDVPLISDLWGLHSLLGESSS